MPRLAAPLLPLSLLALALAGCSGPQDADAPGGGAAEPAEGEAQRAGLPGTKVGDWWNFTTSMGSSFTLVVAADAGAAWTFGTDSASLAFFDAREDISYLGPQRKSDLAGSQGSQAVQFFRFPLEDGATWSTTWDGQAVTVAAAREGDAFRMVASNATGPYATYLYDPAVGWMRELAFLAPDGTESFRMDLAAAGGNYAGPVVSWQLEAVADATGQGPLVAQHDFQVPDGATDVHVTVSATCQGGWVQQLLLPVPPDAARPMSTSDGAPCTGSFHTSGAATAEGPTPGPWTYRLTIGDRDPFGPAYAYTVLVRTRTVTTLGQA
ncbi:MAG TPA: hypothetical protein VFH47_03420 [Candidatus Thermoplasmatota archaeon]|nr:hypothetical protein [Candidatus Thermoplasmatota archaeon]